MSAKEFPSVCEGREEDEAVWRGEVEGEGGVKTGRIWHSRGESALRRRLRGGDKGACNGQFVFGFAITFESIVFKQFFCFDLRGDVRYAFLLVGCFEGRETIFLWHFRELLFKG